MPSCADGWIFFGPSRDRDAVPGEGEIYAIYVAPDRWSRGIGRGLWEEARRVFRAGCYRVVSLWVFQANVRARRFYERLGFAEEPGARKLFERDGATAPEVRYRQAIEGASVDTPLKRTDSGGG